MVEVTWNSVKARVGETIWSRNLDSRVNEVICKLIVHNLTTLHRTMAELDIVPDFLGPKARAALGASYAAGRIGGDSLSDYSQQLAPAVGVSEAQE